ncbi:MAG: sn-glycerol-3-phosphate ABC transporter ATP-binding protein UgpC [Rhodothermales bacterium]
MSSVRLNGIRKIYEGGVVAVNNASFEIADGEFVVLVGPSGCGKSTTLRMIAGLESISDGTLSIGDQVVNDLAPKDRDIAMVFQNYALYPHMTVRENMGFGLKLRKYPKEEIRERVEQAADVLGIRSILDRKPKQLSGGQRQRVAVGRAIVRKPKVFLFDEPLSNLDAKLRVQMRTEISKLHQRLGATMIYVTHDQVEAMTMGDRIVVMKDGVIQQIDTPLNLYNKPANAFVGGFIGSPAMNFMPGVVEAVGVGLVFRVDEVGTQIPITEPAPALPSSASGTPMQLGIRPEDLYVAGDTPAPSSTHPIETTLEVVEPMGNEMFVYVQYAGQQLVARVAPQALPEPGATVTLRVDLGKLHFFDRESGLAIR